MNRKNWLLVALLAILAVVYAVWFTDWFRPAKLGIYHASRSFRGRPAAGGAMPNLMFGLNQPLRLNEIRVVSLAALATNPAALPVWHLVSDSNSVPIKSFSYGQNIRGLRPAVPGSRPQLLVTNTTYRMILVAGKIHGEHDFAVK